MSSVLVMRHVLVTWVTLVTFLSCWLTWKTVQSCHQSSRPSLRDIRTHSSGGADNQRRRQKSWNQTSRSRNSSILNVMNVHLARIGLGSQMKPILWLTMISSIGFSLSMISYLIVYVIIMIHLYWNTNHNNNDNDNDEKHNLQKYQRLQPYFGVSSIIQLFSYSMLSLVVFQRHILTFDGTAFMMNEHWIKMIRIVISCIIALFGLCFICYFIAEYYDQTLMILTLSLLAPGVLLYPLILCFISYRFLSNTLKLCQNMDMQDQRSMELLHVALRLTISTIFAVISTILTNLGWMMWLTKPSNLSLTLMMGFIRNLDSLLNVMALHCTLKHNEHFYLILFGWIHRSVLKKMMQNDDQPSPTCSDSNMKCSENASNNSASSSSASSSTSDLSASSNKRMIQD